MRFTIITAALLAALSVFAGPAAATTNPRAIVTPQCVDGAAVVGFSYSGFSVQNHLSAAQVVSVDGVEAASSIHTFDGPGSSDSLTVELDLKPGESATVEGVTVVVGGGGGVKAQGSATVTCSQPDEPPPPCVGCNPPPPCQEGCAPTPPPDRECKGARCGELPLTGAPAWALALVGFGLVGAGVFLRRRRPS